MGELEYVEPKLMARLPRVDVQESYVGLKGRLSRVNLFELTDSEALAQRVVEPLLQRYRG